MSKPSKASQETTPAAPEPPQSITAPELTRVREAAHKAQQLQLQALMAQRDVKIAQLELFVAYGLRMADSINLDTGVITRAP